MTTPALLRALVELSACETVDALVDAAFALLDRELGVRGRLELWDGHDMHVVRGEPVDQREVHRTWIGVDYTIGVIELDAPAADREAVEFLALAERLMEREASRQRTIREDIERLYERRIRDALFRCDWNFSAVARELLVSRGRVAEVARRLQTRPPSLPLSRSGQTTGARPSARGIEAFGIEVRGIEARGIEKSNDDPGWPVGGAATRSRRRHHSSSSRMTGSSSSLI